MGLSFALALLGFAALALAMRGHHRELFGVDCSRRRSGFLRVVGALFLAVSYGRLGITWGVIEGTIEWLCLASMAAIVIVFILSIAGSLSPRMIRSIIQDPRARVSAPAVSRLQTARHHDEDR
ncbi:MULTISPECIES: DUF3325 domain-containing protein [unclassified Pseudomonas]|uniref:DUF3325 domain-containing protein n=1 Tax=unclassified Pseudomonas TaxID=196821 RepID=UPI000C889E2A|nr:MULTISPECIES: DUF3325 domain-containing protein [unclassified Pseudomonas]PMX27491.1 DUF3325 domain-containing protein [Pseudomonas sp. GW460-12]PMX29189.1 DUF3325 domain-containing protein [Pseudomonas sp. MPR-R2A4]PMX41848.1 DUF3325 domain-containing protein [Pseudomonas sp. MPR-R2A7]PMX46785.1 DUF3325 domain-containing protein [Pseudomonas sp. MPR-R2A6]PMX91285.1 DUF3325 domain-containing protein [Pseudomonas sp. MPR-R2A3]